MSKSEPSTIGKVLEFISRVGSQETWVTFYIKGFHDSRWIQFTGSELNASYPFTIVPESNEEVKNIDLKFLSLLSWKPMTYANFSTVGKPLDAIEEWITSYFNDVLKCSDGDFELGFYGENTGTPLDDRAPPSSIEVKKKRSGIGVVLRSRSSA